MAQRFGLPAGIPVSTATIDAHAGVPGAGAAEPGTLVTTATATGGLSAQVRVRVS